MKACALLKRSDCSDSSSFSNTERGSSLLMSLKEHCSSCRRTQTALTSKQLLACLQADVDETAMKRWTVCYLGELVEAEDLFAVVVAMATLLHQPLELDSNLISRKRKHHKRREAAERGSCKRNIAG